MEQLSTPKRLFDAIFYPRKLSESVTCDSRDRQVEQRAGRADKEREQRESRERVDRE